MSQPEQLPEEGAGAGMVLAQQGHCSPLPRWPSHGGPGRVGHSQGRTRQPAPLGEQSTGRAGGGAEESQVGVLVVRGWAQAAVPEAPCSEPAPGPSTALPGGLPGRTAALTLRENINLGTFLPGGASRCGDEGNSVAENTADGCQPGAGPAWGLQTPTPPPREQAQAGATRD